MHVNVWSRVLFETEPWHLHMLDKFSDTKLYPHLAYEIFLIMYLQKIQMRVLKVRVQVKTLNIEISSMTDRKVLFLCTKNSVKYY